MRIVGKKLTAKEVKNMGTLNLLRSLMFYAASYDARQTKSAEVSMYYLLCEIANRANCPITGLEIGEIIKHY